MNANEKRADAIEARLWGECRDDSGRLALHCVECRRAIIADVDAAAERRGEDRVLRWMMTQPAVPCWIIERYREARRRARGIK